MVKVRISHFESRKSITKILLLPHLSTWILSTYCAAEHACQVTRLAKWACQVSMFALQTCSLGRVKSRHSGFPALWRLKAGVLAQTTRLKLQWKQSIKEKKTETLNLYWSLSIQTLISLFELIRPTADRRPGVGEPFTTQDAYSEDYIASLGRDLLFIYLVHGCRWDLTVPLLLYLTAITVIVNTGHKNMILKSSQPGRFSQKLHANDKWTVCGRLSRVGFRYIQTHTKQTGIIMFPKTTCSGLCQVNREEGKDERVYEEIKLKRKMSSILLLFEIN